MVSTFNVRPGAHVLWCLRRRNTDVRCVIYPGVMPVEVRVLQDQDLVLTELFQEEWLAKNWANAYGERLKTQGWHDPDRNPATRGRRRTARKSNAD